MYVTIQAYNARLAHILHQVKTSGTPYLIVVNDRKYDCVL